MARFEANMAHESGMNWTTHVQPLLLACPMCCAAQRTGSVCVCLCPSNRCRSFLNSGLRLEVCAGEGARVQVGAHSWAHQADAMPHEFHLTSYKQHILVCSIPARRSRGLCARSHESWHG